MTDYKSNEQCVQYEITAEALMQAGFADLEKLAAASAEELQAVEGVGPKLAKDIVEWSGSQLESSGEQVSTISAGMGDQDFMAALSKALDESTEEAEARAAAEKGSDDEEE